MNNKFFKLLNVFSLESEVVF